MSFLDEIEERNVNTNGIRLHTVLIGKGKPLVLLHGFPDFWYGWKSVIPGLRDHFRLILPDMRGYNTSDKPEGMENYGIDILVQDMVGLFEELGFDKINLAGHDWGGLVAWAVAEQYPDLIEKLIILNAPHPKAFLHSLQVDKQQQRASAYIFKFQTPEGEKFLLENDFQGLQLAVFAGPRNRKAFSKEDRKRYFDAWSRPGAISAGVNYYRAFPYSYKGTGIIKVPTLVIWGMKDIYLLPQQLIHMSDYVENLKIIRSEKSTHWILHDDPALVVQSMRDFIG
ncbi:MAG: alpha/beta fold hydrolase [Candidatus Helarchaeota archaeon]